MKISLNKLTKMMIVLLLGLIITLGSCKTDENDSPDTPDIPETPDTISCEKDSYKILPGTIYETTVYTFVSTEEGPRIFIMGGTHGDELAGWKAALELVNKEDWHGTIMLIPQCNILADQLKERYPGISSGGTYNGVKYKDLNRNFPGKSSGEATEKIAAAITAEIVKFNPTYAIDLHESRASASEGRVGETIIYGNKKDALIVSDMLADYNDKYLQPGEQSFAPDTNPPAGSFNNYFSSTYDIHTFTIETNRQLELSRRIEQQLQLLEIMFSYFWN